METIKFRYSLRNLFSGSKKKLLIGLIFVLFIGTTATLLVYSWRHFQKAPSQTIPSPSPLTEVSPIPKRIPSSLATDSGFLKLEEDLKLLEQDLVNVDLSEPKLSPPILEMNVNFEK